MKQQVPAGIFKAKCLQLLDDVQRTRQEIVVTKRGRAIARLVPLEHQEKSSVFGRMAGTVEILGDIVGPAGERWEADE